VPQGRGKPKRKRKPKKDDVQPQLDAVLVTVKETEDGRAVEVSTIGNIKLTEAATLLKLGAKAAEKQLGLE